jgi:hypothetical protein
VQDNSGILKGKMKLSDVIGSDDHRKFRDVIVSKMDPSQTPNYSVVGAPNPEFEKQKPFTI